MIMTSAFTEELGNKRGKKEFYEIKELQAHIMTNNLEKMISYTLKDLK